jgi:hypothetical protein
MVKKVFVILAFLASVGAQGAEKNSIIRQREHKMMLDEMVESLQPRLVMRSLPLLVSKELAQRCCNNAVIKAIRGNKIQVLQRYYGSAAFDINKPLLLFRWRSLEEGSIKHRGFIIHYNETPLGLEDEEVDIKECGTPLEFSLKYYKWSCALWLLKQGATLDHLSNKPPLLHRAVVGYPSEKERPIRREIVELLLKQGASVHERTKLTDYNENGEMDVILGDTALGACVKGTYFFEDTQNHTSYDSPYKIAQLLIEQGAQLSAACRFASPFISEAYMLSRFNRADDHWLILNKLLYKRMQIGYRDALRCCWAFSRGNKFKIPQVLCRFMAKKIVDETIEDVVGGLEGRLNVYGAGVDNLLAAYDILSVMEKKESTYDRRPFTAQCWYDDYEEFHSTAIYEKSSTSDKIPANNLIRKALSFKFE